MTAVATTATSVPIGGSLVISNTVANQGTTTTSTGFSIGLYLSPDPTITTGDTYLTSRNIGSLAAGASSSADTTVTIPIGQIPETYYIGAIADTTNFQSESSETNNSLAGNTITITP